MYITVFCTAPSMMRLKYWGPWALLQQCFKQLVFCFSLLILELVLILMFFDIKLHCPQSVWYKQLL